MSKNKLHFYNDEYICYDGLSHLEINTEGDVLPCCPDWHNFYKFGNIYKQDIASIVNSEEAKEFRRRILDGSYKYCNKDICMAASVKKEEKSNLCNTDGLLYKYVEVVRFAHDRTCNLKCITCRNGYIDTSHDIKKLDSLIDTHFLPIIKGAKIVHLNTNGELFASSHCKKLVKSIIENYPDIKFDITSNGVMFTKDNCQDLNLILRMNNIGISLPAINLKTYNKITGSKGNKNFKSVLKNINYLISLKEKKEINELSIIFVVNYYNYKEMIKFASLPMVRSKKVKVYFWEYRPWTSSDLSKDYKKMAVWLPENTEYKRFCKIINNKVFNGNNIYLPEIFNNLKDNCKEKNMFKKLVKKLFIRKQL